MKKNGVRTSSIAANALAKDFDEITLSAPENASHRRMIRSVIDDTIDRIKELDPGSDLTMAGLQAVLWFNEKKLYTHLGSPVEGGGDASDDNYASSAAKFVW